MIRQCIEEARTHHEIDRDVDLEQTVFEVQAMLTAANFLFVLTNGPMPLQQARKGVQNMLDRLSAGRAAKKKPCKLGGRTAAEHG